jgi:hypothetical protein
VLEGVMTANRFLLTIHLLALFIGLTIASAFAQDATRGIAMPVTLTGGVMESERGREADPEAATVFPGLRAVIYPGLKINSRWFVSSAIQFQSTPFSYYEAYYPERTIETHIQQLSLNYTRTGERSSLGFKVGQLQSAFGSFPLRYSDAVNPLLDQPFAYAYAVKFRPDQLPCGVRDLKEQEAYTTYVEHYCGGSTAVREGMIPVTLYGIAGVELNATWRRFDSRMQITNSSPSDPQGLRSHNQHAQ